MRERGIYKLTIRAPEGLVPPEDRQVLEEFTRQSDSMSKEYDLPELEKTERENQLARDINRAVVEVLQKFDLPQLQVSLDTIHIVDPSIFNEHIGKSTGASAIITGSRDIYIQRTTDEQIFINHLAHEMAHSISYLAKTIEAQPGKEGKILLRARKIRAGYSVAFAKAKIREQFQGLNEAITEDLATEIREEYGHIFGRSDEEKQAFGRLTTYTIHVKVMEAVYVIVGEGNIDTGRAMFYRGFIAGDMSMLKVLDQKKKGAVKILLTMGGRQVDAIEAARQLGFNDIVEKYTKRQDAQENK